MPKIELPAALSTTFNQFPADTEQFLRNVLLPSIVPIDDDLVPDDAESHLARILRIAHLDLRLAWMSRNHRAFCESLAFLTLFVWNVLEPAVDDTDDARLWLWWVIRNIANAAGMEPNEAGEDDRTLVLFRGIHSDQDQYASFYKARFRWPVNVTLLQQTE